MRFFSRVRHPDEDKVCSTEPEAYALAQDNDPDRIELAAKGDDRILKGIPITAAEGDCLGVFGAPSVENKEGDA